MIYKIIDNYAPKEMLESFKENLYSEQFPWYYHDYVAKAEVKEPEEFYFTHTFFSDGESHTFGVNSDYFEKIIVPLCFIRLGRNYELIRAKANLFTKRDKLVKYGLHTDYKIDKHTTWVYSLNTNNGYTEFEDGTKIPSIENQLLMFDGNIPHRSVGQTDTRARINLNINFKMDPEILCKS